MDFYYFIVFHIHYFRNFNENIRSQLLKAKKTEILSNTLIVDLVNIYLKTNLKAPKLQRVLY